MVSPSVPFIKIQQLLIIDYPHMFHLTTFPLFCFQVNPIYHIISPLHDCHYKVYLLKRDYMNLIRPGNLALSVPLLHLCHVKINYRFWWCPACPPNEESPINTCLMVSSTDEQSQSMLCGL